MDVAIKLLTPAEYLEFERQSATKHEYFAGRIVEMAGATRAHNLIASNVIIALGSQLLDKSAGEIYPGDMRVRVPATDSYTYPDVTIVASEGQLEVGTNDILINPTIIVEVLSDSTEKYDRGEKFHSYRTIASLQEYIMIAQDSYHVEHYRRQPNGEWLLSEANTVTATIYLPTIDCILPLARVYKLVKIAPKATNGHLNGHVN